MSLIKRLTRRGLGLSTALLTAGLAREAQAAVVPHALAEITIRAATLVAAGCSLTGLVAASVHSLTEEVCQAMFLAKLKGILFGLVTLGAVTTGAIVLAQATPGQSQTKPAEGPTATRSDPDRLHAVEQKLDRILEALGRPGPAPSAPAGGTPHPDLAPTALTPVTARVDKLPQPGAPAPLSYGSSDTLYVVRDPNSSSMDRLTTLERRMADLERRMVEIERRLAQPLPSLVPATTSPRPPLQ